MRLIVEIAFVSPALLHEALLPLGALAALLIAAGIVAWRGIDAALPPDEPDNRPSFALR